jgi:hypothetical protein
MLDASAFIVTLSNASLISEFILMKNGNVV